MRRAVVTFVGLLGIATGCSSADRHIEVTRDVMIETGISAHPYSITRAPDGGYVIAGSIAPYHAWATRLTSSLGVMWRVEEPERPLAPARDTSSYEDAVVLADNSVLLCGVTEVGPRGTTFVGLITRVDVGGRVIDRRELPPPENYALTPSGGKCIHTRDGVLIIWLAIAITGRVNEPIEDQDWIVAVDEKGILKWQKMIPVNSQSLLFQAIDLPNGNVAIYGYGYSAEFDTQGTLRSQRLGVPILSWKTPALAFAMMPGDAGGPETVDDRLKARVPDKFAERFAYALPDGGLALFGNHEKGNVYTAAIAYVSPDFRTKGVYLMKERDDAASWIIAGVTPTGVPGEFATARLVVPSKLGPGAEAHMGLGLAFVRFR